jgi:hypothetical protein
LWDYSLSQVGPGKRALSQWERARARGLHVVAKVQINNTWECSAVPWLPVADLVQEHLDRLAQAGVSDLMLSWTLGGYPSGNMALLQRRPEAAAREFGEEASSLIREAWRHFSTALKEFPFHVGVLYCAPQNFGPMNLLHAEPTGYHATMIGFCYDDLEYWRSIYPEDVFEDQFRKLSEGWAEGLRKLEQAETRVAEDRAAAFREMKHCAEAAFLHFRSTYLQTVFFRQRTRSLGSGDAAARQRMIEVLDEEIDLARRLCALCARDSRIGFEPSNHYYYTRQDLREKVLNCENLKSRLQRPGRSR